MQNQEPDGTQSDHAGQAPKKHFLASYARIRGTLALIIVAMYMLGLAFIIFAPLIWNDNGLPLKESIGHAKEISSIFNGLIGMIVGYYFGKS